MILKFEKVMGRLYIGSMFAESENKLDGATSLDYEQAFKLWSCLKTGANFEKEDELAVIFEKGTDRITWLLGVSVAQMRWSDRAPLLDFLIDKHRSLYTFGGDET